MPVISTFGAMSSRAFGGIGGGSKVLQPVTLTSGALINGQSNLKQITVSDYIEEGGTLIIPANFWVWSDSTSTAALTIDIECTIKNSGKIIGKGGRGGHGHVSGTGINGLAGGPAVKINSSVSNVIFINNSGAYVAGGGGGGGGNSAGSAVSGGGGGAGGGNGGNGQDHAAAGYEIDGGTGGILNATGGNGQAGSYGDEGVTYTITAGGGGSGGAGGSRRYDKGNGGGGGGGGRILPGTGGAPIYTTQGNFALGGTGGSAGNAGTTTDGIGGAQSIAGGGGGWGASGGNGDGSTGGAGGKAIEDSGNTYTLTNNGTIYGATT